MVFKFVGTWDKKCCTSFQGQHSKKLRNVGRYINPAMQSKTSWTSNNFLYPYLDFDWCLVIYWVFIWSKLIFWRTNLKKNSPYVLEFKFYIVKAFAPTWIVLCPVFFACHKIQKFTIGKNISLKEHSKCKHDFLDNSSFQPLVTEVETENMYLMRDM